MTKHDITQIDLMFRSILNKTMAARLEWESCKDRECLDHLEAVRAYVDTIFDIITEKT